MNLMERTEREELAELQPTRSDRRIALLATVGIPLALLGFLWATTPHTELNRGLETDGVFYLAMAKRAVVHGPLSHTSPMAFRVLTPFLANLLPFGGLTGFSVLGFLSNWATLALLYAVLRRSGISQRGAIVGLLLYSGVFWTLKYAFYSPALVDFQTQLFLVGICYLMLRRWWWAVGPAIALGVAQKESILAMALVAGIAYVTAERDSVAKRALVLGSFFVPGALVYAGLRAAITPLKEYPSGIGLMTDQAVFWAHPQHWGILLLCVFSGLGVLPLLAFVLRKDLVERRRDDLHWLAMIGVGAVLLLGGLAKSRLFLYMLPAVVVLVARALDRRFRNASRAGWAWLGITLAVHFAFGYWFLRVGPYTSYLRHINPEFSTHLGTEPYLRVAAIAGAWCLATLALRKRIPQA
jgi:hypothetical protein